MVIGVVRHFECVARSSQGNAERVESVSLKIAWPAKIEQANEWPRVHVFANIWPRKFRFNEVYLLWEPLLGIFSKIPS